jgi:hypothetical protein
MHHISTKYRLLLKTKENWKGYFKDLVAQTVPGCTGNWQGNFH